MARNRTEQGFTLVEVSTVCVIVGVLAVMAFPSMKRFNAAQEAKAGATKLAGVLEDARSRAVSEATPHLVYVNDPGTGGGSSDCGALAVVVRDADRSYSITDGDKMSEVTLPGDSCKKVKLYAQDETATPYENLRLPAEDQSLLETVVGGVVGGLVSGEDDDDEGEEESSSSGEGSGSSETLRVEKVEDSVVNGSTFPIDEASGRPVIAFSERGIPVDPSNPTRWGSGAGAIYLTDGQESVYAAVVQPMGNIKLRKYEPATGHWR